MVWFVQTGGFIYIKPLVQVGFFSFGFVCAGWFGLCGLVWFGLDWIGLFGLFGLVWSGLVWFDLLDFVLLFLYCFTFL